MILLATAALGAAPAGAQAVDPAIRTELVQARDAIWRAWFAHDTAALARLLPEAVAAGSGRSWQDRAAILEESRQFAAGGGRLVALEFRDTEITLSGDVAVVRSVYRLETERAGVRSTSGGRAVEVFVRRDGEWTNPFWRLSEGGP